MPGPSDIRVNPFNNATNYVNLTERHIVPSVSPFVVRLNEVPEKQDPSNMQMYYVDDTTGQTTETALTEVAATPGAGEFRPDYSTNAFDDTSWNTGLIEFSSADAGKIIEVSYTATGTLAGVKTNRYPAWWLDRGDGSDGAFNPTGNTTISGEKNYTSVFIPAGVTVTVTKCAKILCQGGFINKGVISANGQGALGGYGYTGAGRPGQNAVNFGGSADSGESVKALLMTGFSGYAFGAGGGGGGQAAGSGYAGGAGGLGGAGGNGGAGVRGESNRSGYGVSGGNGGGGIVIVTNEFTNMGSITANGNNGGNANRYAGAGGGGGGGVIVVISNTVNSEGTISVTGGRGGANGGPGAGAAGETGYMKVVELGVF